MSEEQDVELTPEENDRFWEWLNAWEPGSILTCKSPMERIREMLRLMPDEPEPGRNDPCWCGSGKKYKKCCLE